MLLLGGNASGDYKIKPLMVYHSQNPRALKGYFKEGLPVVWRSNKKAWITASLFESYFASELHHELKVYCERVKVPFKILLLLDNAPGHPPYLSDIDENIHVMFLPPTPHLLSNLWIRVPLPLSRVITFGRCSSCWLRILMVKTSFL
jgi:hypothetical protein